MANNNTKHQENLTYIAKILADKPVTADRIKQSLEFSANNLVGAKIVFPDLPISSSEFAKELSNNETITNNHLAACDLLDRNETDEHLSEFI